MKKLHALKKKKKTHRKAQLTPQYPLLSWTQESWSRGWEQGLAGPRLHSWGTAGQLSPTWEDAFVDISGCRLTIGGWGWKGGSTGNATLGMLPPIT